MKPGTFMSNRKFPIVLGLMLMAVLSFAGQSIAKMSAEEVDASVDAALDRFHKQVKGSDEAARNAKGLLIMPNVKKAGLIIGGEYGTGALRIDGKTVGYYRIVSGSVGFQIGA